MRTNEPKTPLLALLRACDDAQRAQLAADSETPLTYLYALGSCDRKSCRADKALKIEAASRKLAKKHGTPIVTVQQLATMCKECS